MKPALQIRVNQQLSLTPQLQQAIRLLQLSSLELELELNTAVESNPLLEVSEGVADDDDEESEEVERSERDDEITSDRESSLESSERQGDDDYSTGSTESGGADDFRNERDDMPLDLAFERNDYAGSGNSSSGDEEGGDREDAATEDLRDHLFWQLNLTPMSPLDRAIAATIIDGVDDDGYLTESNESITSSVATLAQVSDAEIEAVRSRLQQFDPTGVASRDLRECLIAQLSAFSDDTGGLELARRLVNECLEQLARNDRPKLCHKLHAEAEHMDAAINLIRSLNPKPGSGFSNAQAEFIAPDAYARKIGQHWQIALSPTAQPKLTINSHYASLIARVQRDDANYLRGQLQEARWLIKSLQARADTILKVATAIVAAQEAFLEYGPEAMRPLVLKDVAEEIGMHESTVSRVTTRKYLHTPRGTFEFKYFFSSGVSTVDGGAASATAIQAMIRKLVADEQSDKPLSDQAMAAELNQRGIGVARRTVAKYRESLHIPPSNERCRIS